MKNKMKKRYLITVTLVPLWLLTACRVGPDFDRQQLPIPEASGYTTEPVTLDNSPASSTRQQLFLGQQLTQAWWQLFGSQELNQLVEQALNSNYSLRAASQTLEKINAFARAQECSFYPQLSLNAGTGRTTLGDQALGPTQKPPTFTYYAIGPTINYLFDYTGGQARAVEQRYAEADYQRYQLNAAHLAVTGDVVLNSLQIASLQQQITTVQSLLDQDKTRLNLIRKAHQIGSISRLEIIRAEEQLAETQSRLPNLYQQLSQSRHALAIALGQGPQDKLPKLNFNNIKLPENLPIILPSELVRQRPDILAAEAQLHAATAAVGVAASNLYPQINLSSSFSQQSLKFDQLFNRSNNGWNLLAGLTAPIFDGGTLRAEHQAAKAEMQASMAQYQQVVLAAFFQVADSLKALEYGAAQFSSYEQAKQAASTHLQLMQTNHQAGNIGVLAVIEAQRRYHQANLTWQQGLVRRYLDTAQLFLSLGVIQPVSLVNQQP